MQSKSAIRTAIVVALAVATSGFAPGSRLAGQAHAAGIQRCTLPDGGTLYTDTPCSRHGATPAPMNERMVANLVDAQQAETSAGGSYVDASLPLQPHRDIHFPRRPAAAGCARSATQLAMDLQASFGQGEVNRIAESFHWVGMDQASATHVMQRLERLGQSTLVDVRFHDATIMPAGTAAWADAGATAGTAIGIMELTFGGELVDLDVERYSGCYFVSF